jgi:hypothetical protein
LEWLEYGESIQFPKLGLCHEASFEKQAHEYWGKAEPEHNK